MLTIASTPDPPGLHLSGDVDASNVDQLELALEPLVRAGGEITLDVSGLDFIGSAGVQVLIRSLLALEGRGRMVLGGPTEMLRKLVAIMGLDRFPHLEIR